MFSNLLLIFLYNSSTRISQNLKIDTGIKQLFHFDSKIANNSKMFSLRILIAVFYSLHSVLSLKALSGLNIPIYIMFKRCTPFVNLVLSIFVFQNTETKKRHSKNIIISILMMTMGVVIASIGDLEFDFFSYLYCGFSVICQAFYLSTIQKYGEIIKTNSLQTFYECSILSIPILLVFFMVTDERTGFLTELKPIDDLVYDSVLILVIISGSLLCFSQFWCTLKNNAITTSVLGVLKSLIQTLIGILLFQSWDSISGLTYLGITINLIFGTLYTYLKYAENESFISKSESNDKLLDGESNRSNC
ncbi:UDP-sugar transporter -like protein [Brachionus plicatilis]|uniref:UDP-sugar transporter-like protein n=1 Tax=Brachionus plicatilis TaxID=10195 RepID=A0A3M7QMD6_BRAPC|nr:UDP-sugar transporter -like protein [Brachionus plicatilis]